MKGKVLVLAVCMLFTGTINTISTKFQVSTAGGYYDYFLQIYAMSVACRV